MSRANDCAFPATREDPYVASDGTVVGTESIEHGGLTIREHFAVMAMQGFLANSQCKWDWGVIAASAVDQADQLIAELAREPRK